MSVGAFRGLLGLALGASLGALILFALTVASGTSPTTVATLSILWFAAALGGSSGLLWSE